MQERIEKLRTKKGISVSRLEKEIGFSNASLKKINEKTECSRIYALAKYFNVSMEYLITGNELQPVYSPQIDDFVSRLNKLPTEYKNAVYEALEYQEYRYKKELNKKDRSRSSKEA